MLRDIAFTRLTQTDEELLWFWLSSAWSHKNLNTCLKQCFYIYCKFAGNIICVFIIIITLLLLSLFLQFLQSQCVADHSLHIAFMLSHLRKHIYLQLIIHHSSLPLVVHTHTHTLLHSLQLIGPCYEWHHCVDQWTPQWPHDCTVFLQLRWAG